MKKKENINDLEIYIDPKPLTKEEEKALSLFIRQLKEKKKGHRSAGKQNLRRRVAKI